MNDKTKDIYYCFRYRCKRCPKQRECKEDQKKLLKHKKNGDAFQSGKRELYDRMAGLYSRK